MRHDPTPDPELLEHLRTALDSQYLIEGELGGGMSRVFTSTERALGRRVVIKVLPPELTAGVNRDRFRREIQVAARLQHPHIVPLLTAGQVGEILYYTMPLVEGESLRARLDQRGRLDAAAVVAILQDVVDALAYAHGQGLVHRDIKPENILLQRNHALLTDFGVAKAITESLTARSGVTAVGVAVGTPAYMAPEQLAADPAVDHRVDIYAIGLLAYELLSGSTPFSGSSPQRTLARQLTERPTPPHIQRAEVPDVLSDLIMRCLEKEPGQRWQSADDLLQALNKVRLIGANGAGARPDLDRPGPRRRLWALAGALAAITIVAIAGYQIGNRAPTTAPVFRSDTAPPAGVAAVQVLTRADSEAIAASVARRMVQQGAAPERGGLSQKEFDSMRVEVERAVTDSFRRILAARPREIVSANVPGAPGATTTPGWLQSRRGVVRVAVLDVRDASRDSSLGGLAAALTDSLTRLTRRRPATEVLSGEGLHGASQVRGDPRLLARQLGVDVLVRGVVELRGDSVRLMIMLHDTQADRFGQSLRSSVPRADGAAILGPIADSLAAWLAERHPPERTNGIPGVAGWTAADSLQRWARQVRDSMIRTRGRRPDSIPPTA